MSDQDELVGGRVLPGRAIIAGTIGIAVLGALPFVSGLLSGETPSSGGAPDRPAAPTGPLIGLTDPTAGPVAPRARA